MVCEGRGVPPYTHSHPLNNVSLPPLPASSISVPYAVGHSKISPAVWKIRSLIGNHQHGIFDKSFSESLVVVVDELYAGNNSASVVY